MHYSEANPCQQIIRPRPRRWLSLPLVVVIWIESDFITDQKMTQWVAQYFLMFPWWWHDGEYGDNSMALSSYIWSLSHLSQVLICQKFKAIMLNTQQWYFALGLFLLIVIKRKQEAFERQLTIIIWWGAQMIYMQQATLGQPGCRVQCWVSRAARARVIFTMVCSALTLHGDSSYKFWKI